MKPTLILTLLFLLSPIMWFSCTDEFNDPNPKSSFQHDLFAPDLVLFSPVEGGVYVGPNLKIQMNISDSFNLKSASIQLASIGKPAPGFSETYKPSSRFLQIDTVYTATISDTIDFQMLVVSADSSGNVLSKSINFKMIKP